MFFIIKGNVIHAYLGYNRVAFKEHLMGSASLIKEMSRKTPTFIIDCISEEVFNGIDGQTKVSVDSTLYWPSVKMHFPVEFQIISNTFLFISK
jgi:hypothetical protein